MPVFITNEIAGPCLISISSIQKTAERLLYLTDRQGHELSILLVGDARITQLNKDYRNKNKPTNVLAFAMQEGAEIKYELGSKEYGEV